VDRLVGRPGIDERRGLEAHGIAPALAQPSPGRGDQALRGHPGQRDAPPSGQRGAEQRQPLGRSRLAPGRGEGGLEGQRVDGVDGDVEPVGVGGHGDEHHGRGARRAGRLERAPQLGDVGLHGVPVARRRRVGPQGVDDVADGHGPAGVQRQHGGEAAHPGGQGDGTLADRELERPEQPDAHGRFHAGIVRRPGPTAHEGTPSPWCRGPT
jgi:hypothetical protein